MKYAELIFENVQEQKVVQKNGVYLIDLNKGDEKFTSKKLKYLVSDLKYLLNNCWDRRKDVVINLGKTIFTDKISYLVLDTIIFYFLDKLKNIKLKVKINFKFKKSVINNGFIGTALYKSLKEAKSGYINRETFLKEYTKEFTSNRRFYRRIITADKLKSNLQYPSIIFSDIGSILELEFNDDEWIDAVSEIASELVCNIGSHTDGDCLIHFDIVKDVQFNNKNNTSKKYNCVCLSILNLAPTRLFDKIKENLKSCKYDETDSVYKQIYQAYNNHKEFFDKEYEEDDFFFITAFQNHVTTRQLKSGNGGTGLTNLIERIIDKTEKDYSYVLSGKNIIFFQSECLGVSEVYNKKMVGFNKKRDYIKSKPDRSVINRSNLYIPGCAYNLLLVKEK